MVKYSKGSAYNGDQEIAGRVYMISYTKQKYYSNGLHIYIKSIMEKAPE